MRDQINILHSFRLRDYVQQTLYILTFLSLSLVGWTLLTRLTWCDNSIVVVISGSMEPGYRRGDLLLLHQKSPRAIAAGDIVVYALSGKEIPIVHRVIEAHGRPEDGRRLFLTKGDNNRWDDRALYPGGAEFIAEDQILGKVFAKVSFMGYATIMVNEVPVLKWATMGLLFMFLLTSLE